MRTFQLPSGRTIQLDDADFRAIVHSNREAALKALGVRKRPGFVIEDTEDGEGVRVRLGRSGEAVEAQQEDPQ